MTNHTRPRRRALPLMLATVLAASMLGVFASPAHAAYECGKLVTSPPDDAPNTASGGDEENVDNLDIVGAGINSDDGTTVKVAIGLKDLSKDMPSNATSIAWYFQWTYGDVNYFGRATIAATAPDTVNFAYGTFAAPQYSVIAATEGVFTEGENGIVEVHVPYEGVGAPASGDALTQVYATTHVGQGVGVNILTNIDRGPKEVDTYGTDHIVGSCAGGGGGGGNPGGEPGGEPLASPKAGLGFNDKTPKRGETITAKARLRVCGDHAGTNIELQKKVAGRFKKIASKKLSSSCKASFKVVAKFKSATFRSFWKQQDDDHRSGQSKPVTVTTHS